MKRSQNSNREKYGQKAIFIVIGVTLAMCFITISALNYGYSLYDRHLQQNVEKNLQLKVNSYGNYLELVIKERFRILENLEDFCQERVSEPKFEDNFQIFASGLTAGFKGIQYVALAPKDEVTFIYPMFGHEELFGETLHSPELDTKSKKIERKKIIIDMSAKLINGEKMLNAYIPIFINDEYWGLATIQMSIPRLLFEAGLNKRIPGVDYTIRTSNGFILRGDQQVFSSSPVSYAIPISGSYWELAAVPVKGWQHAKSGALISYRIISFLVLLLICGVTVIFTLHYVSLKQTVAEKTAGLNESESRYRYLFENISLPTFLVDQDGRFVDTNQQATSQYQYSKQEFRSMQVADLSADAYKKKVSKQIQKGQKQHIVFDWRHKRKDGTELPVEIDAHTINIDGMTFSLASVRDLTERQKSEEALRENHQLQEQLHQAQKMDAIGQLAGGIAHDFNNQLSGILGYADLLKNKLKEDPKLHKYAEKILIGVKHSTDLTNQLLTFSRKGKQSTVEDTGVGMSDETKSRMFEPFYTTKDPGKGTGMGLAAVYSCVKNHHGAIKVESEEGKGSQINIYLPLIKTQGNKAKSDTEKEKLALDIEGTKQIMLVDDEESILDLAKEMLVTIGYKLITCSNGPDAIEIYQQHWSQIDLVILDVVMPEMGGKETFLALKKINSDIKVLIASGFGKEGDIKEVFEGGANGFIAKPFIQSELADAVAEALKN